MVGDRPAAELLTELDERYAVIGLDPESPHRDLLVRLARAEQALAEAKADAWDQGYFARCHCGCQETRETGNPYRAALRASQGGQT